MSRTICLHGPESTGKTTLAPQLAGRLGGLVVPEYGRAFAEAHGTDFTMEDLVAIGREQARLAEAAAGTGADPLILDTDPLMTAAWADMLFGRRDPWFDAFDEVADLYLLFDADLPWVGDGTRMFGTADRRRRFLDVTRAALERRGVRWAWVRGTGAARLESALDAIRAAGLG